MTGRLNFTNCPRGNLYHMSKAILGSNPKGARLSRIQKSPNYQNGSFVNLVDTPMMPPDGSYWKMLKGFLTRPSTTTPKEIIPVIQTDLNALPNEPSMVWFGHSSYFLKVEGKTILVDPVFSGQIAPVSFMPGSFPGTDLYQPTDFPHLDAVFLTHDHYDHLDYKTLIKLEEKTSHFYTALGVGSHLEYWGVPSSKITELDWWDSATIGENLTLTAAPARHFSGRSFKRAKTLWSAFQLKTRQLNLFLGGDSGYGDHFKEIGSRLGPFDLAILECGQYNTLWPYIHMTPEETVKACQDLGSRQLIPVHWGKFVLSTHPWKEPVERVTLAGKEQKVNVITPKMGQVVNLTMPQSFDRWWDSVS